MNYRCNEGRFETRFLTPQRRAFQKHTWQTTLILASGLTALIWSRLPAAAAPQTAAAQEAPATAQDAPTAQEVPCMLAQDAEGVIVLFSGKAEELTENFTHKDGTAPTWTLTPDGSLLAQTADLMTKKEFDDFQLHVEFKVPPASKTGGKMLSSGIVLHGRFVMQICDSFGISLPGATDNGAVYSAHAPLVNASKASGEWQSYDIIFRAARFSGDGATRLQAASVTAFLNGVLVQNNTDIAGHTEGYTIGDPKKPAPLLLQYKGSPVEFRSIWVLPLSRTTVASPPAALHVPKTIAWQDATQGEKIPVAKVSFDEGGYQVACGNGDTIVVPFANEHTEVMKFGRSDTEDAYFIQDGATPVLYLSNDLSSKGYLENAVVENARWYPLTQDYTYTEPVFVDLAPTWNAYSNMGWYPGMTVYGGVLSGATGAGTTWMPGYYTSIGGIRFVSYPNYIAYMAGHSNFVPNRIIYTNYGTPVIGSGGLVGVKGGLVGGTTRSAPHTTLPIRPGSGTSSPRTLLGSGRSGGSANQLPAAPNGRFYNPGRSTRGRNSGTPRFVPNVPHSAPSTPRFAPRTPRFAPAPPRSAPRAPRFTPAPPRRNAPTGNGKRKR